MIGGAFDTVPGKNTHVACVRAYCFVCVSSCAQSVSSSTIPQDLSLVSFIQYPQWPLVLAFMVRLKQKNQAEESRCQEERVFSP